MYIREIKDDTVTFSREDIANKVKYHFLCLMPLSCSTSNRVLHLHFYSFIFIVSLSVSLSKRQILYEKSSVPRRASIPSS